MASEHKHPNYMAIFWYLAILTVVEIAVIYLPLGKFTIGVLLCALALTKATMVAMYFMHLEFETRTLGLVAVTPLVIATLLIFVLLAGRIRRHEADGRRQGGHDRAREALSALRRRRQRERWNRSDWPTGSRGPWAGRSACAVRAAGRRRSSAAGSG